VVRAALTLLTALMGVCADAAHPLLTEDTATQSAGVVEVENGLAWSRVGSQSTLLYQPQIAYGLMPALDVMVQPAWLWTRERGARAIHGSGDTNLDMKWRFAEVGPWSLALRSGLTLATSEHGLGIAHGRAGAHALVAATWLDAAVAVHANVGVAYLPADAGRRSTVGLLSSAVVWRPAAHWTLLGEGVVQTSAESGSRSLPATVLIGAVRNLKPGFDVDLGYRVLFDRRATTRVALAGFTWHFVP
jgi:hypothetical protein